MTNIFRNLDWSVLTGALLSVIPALICITFHELAHGFTAYRLGDPTAKNMGRLTLNPIKHIDVFGLLMMLIFKFGWAKPVPVNMYNFRKPKWFMAVTALAGPVSNILLAVAVLFIYGLIFRPLGSGAASQGAAGIILDIVERTAYLSVALAIFNLVPIPPLDGSKVLFSFFPETAYYKLMRYERYGIILLIIVLNTNVFSNTIGRLTFSLFSGLTAVARFSFGLFN